MKNYLRSVLIEGIFEEGNDYKIDFTDGSNCIYGDNGTGKTTIINLIVSALGCDYTRLRNIPFKSITLYLAKKNQVRARKFLLVKKTDNKFIDGKIQIGLIEASLLASGLSIIIPNSFGSGFDNYTDSDPNFLEEQKKFKEAIDNEVTLTHVPLLRIHDAEIVNENISDDYLHMTLRKKRLNQKQIAEIIDPSFRVISSIQSQFMDEVNLRRKKITSSLEFLKSQIIEKVMIDSNLIRQSRKAISNVNKVMSSQGSNTIDVASYTNKLKEANIHVPENKLKEHFKLWSDLGDRCRAELKEVSELELKLKDGNNVKDALDKATEKFQNTYFTLFSMSHIYDRFLSIVEDVESVQKSKDTILKIFVDFEKEVNNYFSGNKVISLNDDGLFKIMAGKRKINLQDLSSGEKHIITILGRATLSNTNGAIFVADEPELSLHLDWQRKILGSIRKLSPLSQIIVATHSPAVFTKGTNEIDLEECRK